MTPNHLWRIFLKFRLIVLAIASILSLSFSVFITVYMAKNWSSYDSAERGFVFGLIAVDFVGSILLYLMIVVKYRFWPDAVRSVVLLGLHIAGSLFFTIRSSSFPCSAFGSTTTCHTMTVIIIVGSWVLSALMAMYTISLPVMGFIPRPRSEVQNDDLENPPVIELGEEARESHKSSASLAWLLKDPEGASPDMHTSELPIPPEMPAAGLTNSNVSSSSSLLLPQRVNNNIELMAVNIASPYSDLSRASFVEVIRARESADRGLNSPDSSPSPRHPPLHSDSTQVPALPNPFTGEPSDANRVSAASNPYKSTYVFPIIAPTIAKAPHRTPSTTTESSASAYSQNTARPQSPSTNDIAFTNSSTSQVSRRNPLASTLMPDIPGRLSVHSMMASVHDHAEPRSSGVNYDTTSNGFLSPPLTALPSPWLAAGATETSFELHLSDPPQRESKDGAELVTAQRSAPVQPSLNHVRTDSTTSNVDLDEWKKLVFNAAGRGQ